MDFQAVINPFRHISFVPYRRYAALASADTINIKMKKRNFYIPYQKNVPQYNLIKQCYQKAKRVTKCTCKVIKISIYFSYYNRKNIEYMKGVGEKT